MPVDGIGKRTGPSSASRLIVRAESSISRLAEPLLILEFAPSSLGSCLSETFPLTEVLSLTKVAPLPLLESLFWWESAGFLANIQMQQCSREPAGTGDLTLSVGNALDRQEGRNPCFCCGLECLSRRSFANSMVLTHFRCRHEPPRARIRKKTRTLIESREAQGES